jgi:hypothetical protein
VCLSVCEVQSVCLSVCGVQSVCMHVYTLLHPKMVALAYTHTCTYVYALVHTSTFIHTHAYIHMYVYNTTLQALMEGKTPIFTPQASFKDWQLLEMVQSFAESIHLASIYTYVVCVYGCL